MVLSGNRWGHDEQVGNILVVVPGISLQSNGDKWYRNWLIKWYVVLSGIDGAM